MKQRIIGMRKLVGKDYVSSSRCLQLEGQLVSNIYLYFFVIQGTFL